MQNTFNFSRFFRLFKKHTLEHYKANLMSAGVLLGLLGLWLGFIAFMSPTPINKGGQGVFFAIGLLLAGSIFTSMIFTDLSDKKKAIATLTLPASHFEKYLVAWLYSSFIFLLVYTASFYLVDFLVINMDNWNGKPKEIVNVFSNKEEEGGIYIVFLIYLFLHALCLWGAIFFQKLHFIKTSFLFFISLAILAFLNYSFMNAYLGKDVQSAIPFGAITIRETHENSDLTYGHVSINLNEEQQPIIAIGFILIAVVLWVASYVRLKEKQV